MFYNQSDSQTQKLESELGVLKDEENKLKDRVLTMQKVCALCSVFIVVN
jgi:cell division protein FtsB